MKKKRGQTPFLPVVGIIMGSDSDYSTMEAAARTCEEFGVPHEVRVVSAHRTPDAMVQYAMTAADRGIRVIIAGAGGAAHLPGMVASMTTLPVIGVPIETRTLKGLDSLLSIVQMPAGVPVATVAIGNGRNAGLLAVKILATHDRSLQRKVAAFMSSLAAESHGRNTRIQAQRSASVARRSPARPAPSARAKKKR
ncbi:MAG: 5-(carboxyamino)imidazole ribonucleotide mutase [Candidatus Hydrogenedentota bacterium]